jgi:hypothetical protein
MKTNNIGGNSKSVKNDNSSWSSFGGNTPPQSKVKILPKDGNKPFLFRLKKWLTD